MAARPLNIAGVALCASTIAVQLPSFLDPSATTAATLVEAPPPLDGALLQIFLLFVVMQVLLAAAPFVYRHAHHAAGAGNRRLSELLDCILCVVLGLLVFFLFVRPAGGAVDGGALARALGLAALRALPASAAATFFLGVALVYAHVAGGNGPVPAPAVQVLAEINLEAAAALIVVMAMAVCAQ